MFSEKILTNEVFEVGNTSDALGFQVPIFFSRTNCRIMSDGLYVSEGVFYIPVYESSHSDLWRKVILNSCCFIGGITFFSDDYPLT